VKKASTCSCSATICGSISPTPVAPSASRLSSAFPATPQRRHRPHNYAADYNASYVRTEKAGAEECNVLELTAKRKGATYQRILSGFAERMHVP